MSHRFPRAPFLCLVRRKDHPVKRRAISLLLAGLLIGTAIGSEEGVLVLRTFQFESRDESGPVVVSGTQSAAGIRRVSIKAFGKSVTLPRADLRKLRGLLVNGVQLSSEGGYPELGGRTIYLVLSTGWTSGVDRAKMIVMKERGDIQVRDVVRR